jgi:hypothetical protein
MLARVISRKLCGNLCMPVEESFHKKRLEKFSLSHDNEQRSSVSGESSTTGRSIEIQLTFLGTILTRGHFFSKDWMVAFTRN